jgi:transitional endoplasmic reticulum ATPase
VARMTKEERELIEARRQEVLSTLAELSGSSITDDKVIQKGTQLIIPESLTPAAAAEFLEEYVEREETPTEFSKTFRYRPWDGAVALHRALIRVTGTSGQPKMQWTFFGRQPPEMRSIPVSVDESISVPWGMVEVPMLEGQMVVGVNSDRTWGQLFHVHITCPRKYKAQVEGLFTVIEEELKQESIYKGKAVDGQMQPEFIDLAGVDPAQVIYADMTTEQLEANLWSVLRFTPQLRKLKIPRKRAILLEGPYGTGKTLAAFLTAQVAIDNGWTFLYCRPARDDLAQVMATARLYQPAVVFFEDVDAMSGPDDTTRDGISQLLDLFDGITAKGTEIVVVLTTNHKERIHRGMVRPGRLDAVIHIGALDQGGVQRMIEASVDPELREANLDYEEIYAAMEGFLPAFVKEAIDRTLRYSLARNGGEVETLVTEDFVSAAEGLRPQLELMEGAKEGGEPARLADALRDEVKRAVGGMPVLDLTDEHVLTVAPTNGG